ncbi:MAG: response regulator transcription factor [Chloroflexi bacterium]|nr:response regulator transcription factor [Chloroflexota bacterium]
MTKDKIRVCIVDDHGVVRAGLRSLLIDSGLDVVGEADNGRAAIEMVNKLQPDVLLLDIRMPDMDGLQALAAIKAAHPQVSVIMLTTYANPEYLARAVALGAAGYLSKEVDPQRIPNAVRAAATGETLLDRTLLQAALQNVAAPSPVEPEPTALPIPDLTDQEVVVLKLIVEGLNNDAIADMLTISRSTVKTHVRHIFQKLDVSDRTQAAVWAVRHGLSN